MYAKKEKTQIMNYSRWNTWECK